MELNLVELNLAIARAKEQLRQRVDRSRPEPGVEVCEIKVRDCGIRGY